VIAAPRCVVNLKTPAFGIRSYVMQAEPGNQLETYWLMFAAAGPGMSAAAIKDAKMPATFADDSRMLRLIEMAASESDSTMDLTVIAIAALRCRRSSRARTSADGAELEAAILDLSKEGSASKTAPGEFSVLHGLETDPADRIQPARCGRQVRRQPRGTRLHLDHGEDRAGARPPRSARRSRSPTARCATTSRSLPQRNAGRHDESARLHAIALAIGGTSAPARVMP
jgi:hypothetical protein